MKLLVKALYFFAFLFSITALGLANGGYLYLAKLFYPYHYREYIEASAKEFSLDPLFVAAVIREESRFRPNIRSGVGAVGLMQLMPTTAAWAAKKIPLPRYQNEQLEDPRTNIRIGCWYLRYLLNQFGSGELVLAAYNGGESYTSLQLNPERHPFAETREYVRRGKATYQMYRRLYGTGTPEIPWIKPTPIGTPSEAPATASATASVTP